MLSMTHMVVLFIVVLVVFGPNKLPELARGLGKLMAEFRKASTDFKSAFEEEMRDLDRQAREVERKKQALLATAAAVAATRRAAGVDAAVNDAGPGRTRWFHQLAACLQPVGAVGIGSVR